MKRFALGTAAALSLWTVDGLNAQPPARPQMTATAAAPPKTYSRTLAIRLPVALDEKARSQVAELKLYVKAPGLDWIVAKSAPASQTAFDYQAERDGEYAFLFATVDKAGRQLPPSPEGRPPHQIIVIDTQGPFVQVQPIPLANKDIALQCIVRDANPDWASVKVEYHVSDNRWAPLAPVNPSSPGVFRIPNPGVLEGKVRASATDKAGNVTVREVDLGDPTSPLQGMNPNIARVGQPVAPILPPGADTARAELPTIPALPSDLKFDTSVIRVPEQPPEKTYPALVAPLGPLVDPAMPTAAMKPPIVPEVPGTLPDLVPASVVAPIASVAPRPVTPPVQQPTSQAIINTTRASLDYAIENIPSGGAARMEFWATADSGRTWQRLSDEAAGRSPARLVLPGEGLYGIRVKANGSGMSPAVGDAPDAWVEVDLTKPAANLFPPVLGSGAETGTLTILWAAQDKNLSSEGISLYYASRPNGPWMPISTGMRNDGNYRWTIPQGIGPEAYLRLEATDRAGNVARVELPNPVPLEAKVRVLGIGPAR